MAPATGVRIAHKRQLEHELQRGGAEAHDSLVARLAEDWARESEPWEAAAHFYLDDVIDPRATRDIVATGIDFAWGSGPRIASERR
jgi:acetyl-CoA carboxylase carboxyltransferase component